MNREFFNALLVLVYLAGAAIGMTLLVGWALKRFGSPAQPFSKTPAPESNQGRSLKADRTSIGRSDHETDRQQKPQPPLPRSHDSSLPGTRGD